MAISFSGLASGLDTSGWVDALVSVKQEKITGFQTDLKALQYTKNTLTDTRAQKISPEDLRELLNGLKTAGAEAISINGQRIVYDSYVVDLGGTFISVNGEREVSPYVVKAIGNPTYLESELSKKQYGYIDKKLEEGKDIILERQENILIDAYKGNLNMEYAY